MQCIAVFKEVGLPPEYNTESITAYAATVASKLDKTTALSDLIALWHEDIALLLDLERSHPKHIWYVEKYHEEHFFMAPGLFFAVFDSFIQETDEVILRMPSESPQAIFSVGYQLSTGTLTVNGDVGSIGHKATGIAKIILNGNADQAGVDIGGNAYLEVNGNVKEDLALVGHGNAVVRVHGDVEDAGSNTYDSLDCQVYGTVTGAVGSNARDNVNIYVQGDAVPSDGSLTVGRRAQGNVKIHITGNAAGNKYGGIGVEATDNALIQIDGNVGNWVGYGVSKHARILIGGNAGDGVGEKAQGEAYIEIHGNAGKDVGKRAYRKARIIVHGTAEAGVPNKSFTGELSINGKRLY